MHTPTYIFVCNPSTRSVQSKQGDEAAAAEAPGRVNDLIICNSNKFAVHLGISEHIHQVSPLFEHYSPRDSPAWSDDIDDCWTCDVAVE